MGTNLELLGLQAIRRLAKKFNLKIHFPTWTDLFGISPENFRMVCDKCRVLLMDLFENNNISWWDVYLNSDIGKERLMLAREIGLKEDDTVLDVGCGRGYFSIAAAKYSKRVVGLDFMDGFGRKGLWRNFKECIKELHLTRKVYGLRADAKFIPCKDSSFSVVAAIHSIRNFPDKQSIEVAISEMKRVARAYLDISSLNPKIAERAKVEYNNALELIKQYGETSPPAILIMGTKK
jgi:cyclopropane fatty-acyl-phospholipid synthase-like methyltransferase